MSTVDPVVRDEFGDSLVSWRDPSFLAPLGHMVSGDAPSGVIHRLIEPSGSPVAQEPGPSLVLADRRSSTPRRTVVQRMLAAFTSGDTPEPVAQAPGEPAPVQAPTVVDAAPVVPARPVQRAVPLTQASPPPSLPVLQLTAVPGASVDAAPSAEPVTAPEASDQERVEAWPEVREEPTLGAESPAPSERHFRTLGPDESAVRTTGHAASHSAEPLGQAPLVGLSPPTALSSSAGPSSSATVQRTAGTERPPVPEPAGPAPSVPPNLPVRPAAAPRRLGLGAPVDPETFVVQRSAPAAPPPVEVIEPASAPGPEGGEDPAGPGAPLADERVAPLLGTPAPGTSPPDAAPEPADPPPVGSVPGSLPSIQRHSGRSDGAAPATPSLPAQPTVTEAPVIAPLIGPPLPPVQRTDAAGPPAHEPGSPPASRQDGLPPTAPVGLPAPVVGREPVVQRSSDAAPPPAVEAVAPLLGAAADGPVAVDRAAGGAAAVQRSGAGEQPASRSEGMPPTAPVELPAPVVGQRPAVQRASDTPPPPVVEAVAPLLGATADGAPVAVDHSPGGAAAVQRSGAGELPVTRSEGPPPRPPVDPIAPLVGQRPAVQRAGDEPLGAPAAGEEATLPAELPPLAAARSIDPAVGAEPVAPLVGPAPPTVQRIDATEHPPVPALPVLRVLAPGPTPRPAEAAPQPAPLAVARIVGDHTARLLRSSGDSAPSAVPPPPALSPSPTMPTLLAAQRTSATVPFAQPAPLVQTVQTVQTVQAEPAPVMQAVQTMQTGPEPVEVDPAALPETGEPAPGGEGAPAAAGAAAPSADELAKKLLEPLLRRIKAELRLDRERRGALTDLRH